MTARIYSVVLALCVASSAAAALAEKPDVTGTYELSVCKSDCELTQSVIAKGTVVLFNRPLSSNEIDKLGPSRFFGPAEALRACFSGARPEHAETYAFIQKTSATSWSFENGVLKIELFRSPDASYEAELRLQGDVLSGVGHSWGAGAGAPRFGAADVITGRRVGPPNISACSPAP